MAFCLQCTNAGCNTTFTLESGPIDGVAWCPRCGHRIQVDARTRVGVPYGETSPQMVSRRPELPEMVGRYRIERMLGSGGMGAVYLAHDTELDRPVALKVPHVGVDDASAFRGRFLREARAAARFRHPNFCPIYDVGEADGRRYLAMAYIAGTTLSDLIRCEGPLDPGRAVGIARTLALAMAEAHRQGIIHRDLKPANVLVEPGGELVITDFGIARLDLPETSILTQTGDLLGTPAYMAPEQVDGDPHRISPAIDIYALGVIFHELLTGTRPFEGPLSRVLAMIVHDSPAPPSMRRPGLDPALDAICLKALARDPADRYPSMDAFADALAHPSSDPTPDPSRGARRRGRHNRFYAGACVALVLGVAAWAIWDRRLPRLAREEPAIAAPPRIAPVGPAPTVADGSTPGRGVPPSNPPAAPASPVPENAPRKEDLKPQHLGAAPKSSKAAEENAPRQEDPKPRDLASAAPKSSKAAEPPAAPPVNREVDARRPGPSGTASLTNSIGMKLVLVPSGEYLMGSPEEERHLADWGLPQHRVRITRPFYIGTTEVTRGQFRQFVEATGYRTEAERNGSTGTWRNPGFEQTDEHPAVHMSWNDAVAFCRWLSQKEEETYRLPTEAEWEYACRAGTTTRYSSGQDPDGLAAVGNFADEAFRMRPRTSGAIPASDGFVHTAPVGRYSPNAWGLFDMHGNVCEWCSDRFEKDYYQRSPVDDPPGPDGAGHRVLRGGSFVDHPDRVRSAYRLGHQPEAGAEFMGFRVVRVPSAR